MTRQRKWQLRQKKLGRCETCGQPVARGYVSCKRHVLIARARAFKYRKPRKKRLD